jgi:hypothetical protein
MNNGDILNWRTYRDVQTSEFVPTDSAYRFNVVRPDSSVQYFMGPAFTYEPSDWWKSPETGVEYPIRGKMTTPAGIFYTDPVVDEAPVVRQLDDVAGIEGEPRRRQQEGRGLTPCPRLHQCPPAAPLSLLRWDCHGEGLGGHSSGLHCRARRLDDRGVVLLVGPRQLPLQRLRQLRLLRPSQLQELATSARGNGEIVGQDGADGPALAHHEADAPAALDCVEAEVPRERGDRAARAFERADEVAFDCAPEAGDVVAVFGRRPARSGCSTLRPTRGRSPPGRPAGSRRRASRARITAGSSRSSSGRRTRSAGWCRGRRLGSRVP